MREWDRCLARLPEGNPRTMGQLLRKMRKEAGYTQVDMAKKVGLSRETVINIEKDLSETISALEVIVVRKWRTACGLRMTLDTIAVYKSVMMQYFKLH
ncbi:MAG: HTH-type transcriptional regulator/antitoxin HipB [Paraglaciecola sp.]|jgi:HTH-type transcriptional regulator/antitoxin HipB